MMFDEYNDMVSVEDISEMLHVGRNSAYKLVASGKIRCFRHNRIWKIPKEKVIQYIRESCKK